MSGAAGWKIATLVLAATSLGLAAALMTSPTPISSTAGTPEQPVGQAAGGDGPPERRHVEPPPPVDPERAATEAAQTIADAHAAKQAAALEAMMTEEVCRRHLLTFEGSTPSQSPTMEQIVARLARDPERAAAILEDWLRRRDEIRAAGLTGPPGSAVSMAYAGLRGADGAPLLREIVFEQRDLEHLPALLRTGDAAALRELDAWQRSLDDEDPWVRLLAVQRALYRHAPWTGHPWPNDVIAHAADAGRTLIELPPPGGRDRKEWKRIQDEVAARIDEIERRPAHERRVREVLGFEGLDGPDGTETE